MPKFPAKIKVLKKHSFILDSDMDIGKCYWMIIGWMKCSTLQDLETATLVFLWVYGSLWIYDWYTSSTAQGGGGSFKNRKPIGTVGFCESRMAEAKPLMDRKAIDVSSLSLSFSDYLPTYLPIYLPMYLSIYLSIYLSFYLSIYLSVYLSMYPSIHLSIYPSICLPAYLWCSVIQCKVVLCNVVKCSGM